MRLRRMAAGLSELGQTETCGCSPGRSAMPSITDIVRQACQVRKVPISDMPNERGRQLRRLEAFRKHASSLTQAKQGSQHRWGCYKPILQYCDYGLKFARALALSSKKTLMQMWPSSHMVRSRGRSIRIDCRFSSWSSAKFDCREARHTACEKDSPSRERRADTNKIVWLYSMLAAPRQERLFWLELLARKSSAASCRIARRDGAVSGSTSLRRSAPFAFSYS